MTATVAVMATAMVMAVVLIMATATTGPIPMEATIAIVTMIAPAIGTAAIAESD